MTAAPKLETATFTAPLPNQGFATVVGRARGSWLLEAPDYAGSFAAERAASCLVEPALGDRVWFVGEDAEHYIIALIAHSTEAKGEARPTSIRVEGDLELGASGQVRVSGEHVELDATRTLALRSRDELSVEARRGRLLLDSLAAFIRTARTHLSESTLVGKVRELIVERLTQHSNTSYRSVAELDHVRAGTLDYKAERGAHIHGENTSMSAAELVKVDAGQIHLG